MAELEPRLRRNVYRKVVDSRAQQSRLSSKQFARIHLVEREDRAHAAKQRDGQIVRQYQYM